MAATVVSKCRSRVNTSIRCHDPISDRCLSVHGGAGACVVAGVCAWCQGACVVLGGMRGIRPDTVNERAVRILLECILVF